METILVEVRQTLRALRKEPGLVALAVLALAMGIGFPTTMFSIVHGGTRGLPFDEAHELVAITRAVPERGIDDLRPQPFDYLEWSNQQTSFEALAAFRTEAVNLAAPGIRPERYRATAITVGTFDLLGERPAFGRDLRAEDASPGAPPVVILSHSLWQTRFAGDPNIIGRTIRADGTQHTVIGVMPERFGFPINSQLWTVLSLPVVAGPGGGRDDLQVFGRLRDGVPLERARTELATIATRLAQSQPATHAGISIRAMPFVEIEMDPAMNAVLYLMTMAVSFVLLIACANVANVLLARAAARTREVAVRISLGASRARVVGQHLVESAAIASAGGVLGVLAADVGVRWFGRMTSGILEAFWLDFRVDGVALTFAITLTAIATIAAGIGPALQASRANVAQTLRDAGPGTSSLRVGRLSRGLVVAEVALSCGLLAVAALLIRGAVQLRAVEFPFDPDQVFVGQLALQEETRADPLARNALYRDIALRLDQAPGLESAALSSAVPGRGTGNWRFLLDATAEPETSQLPSTAVAFVTPGFLDVLDAAVLRGRDISWGDDREAPRVALVNESFVARFSADRDPIGRRFRLPSGEDHTIVGIVPDLQIRDIEERHVADGVYLPLLQGPPTNVRVVAKTNGPPLSRVGRIRDEIEAVNADLPLFEIATLRAAIYADKKVLDAMAALFLLFGAGALVLTATGLYGVVAFSVRQRTRELGIRRALGAVGRDVVGLVLRQGGRQLALGFALGIVLAVALGRAIAATLDFVSPSDPLIVGGITVALALTGLAALIVPAWRAARVTPLEALRTD